MLNFFAKTACLLFICVVIFFSACKETNTTPAQVTLTDTSKPATNPYSNVDQSPLDIAYCPAQYPQRKIKGELNGGPVARVIYSRPHRKGRVIFSNDPNSLCPYGKPWRLGANEATEIEFFKPVLMAGKNVSAGRYIMYCVPHLDKWEIVLNKNLDSWGLNIDRSKDVLTLEAPVQAQDPALEDFTMLFQDTAEGAELLMSWDNVKVQLPLIFSGL